MADTEKRKNEELMNELDMEDLGKVSGGTGFPAGVGGNGDDIQMISQGEEKKAKFQIVNHTYGRIHC